MAEALKVRNHVDNKRNELLEEVLHDIGYDEADHHTLGIVHFVIRDHIHESQLIKDVYDTISNKFDQYDSLEEGNSLLYQNYWKDRKRLDHNDIIEKVLSFR